MSTASPLAPPPRRLQAWEYVVLAVLALGAAWSAKVLVDGGWASLSADLARFVPSSAISQLGVLIGQQPLPVLAVVLLGLFLAYGIRLWAQAARTGVTITHSLKIVLRNLHIALLLAVVNGGIGAVLMDIVSKMALDLADPEGRQQTLIVSELSQSFVLWAWNCTVGAWAAAAGIYLWVQHEKGRPATLYDAVNYGLSRYRRVVGPHARAYLAVAIGSIVIVPGILFGLQYAFVDAIATLDTVEKDPLARSRKLTRDRRGTIFRTFAAFVVWWLPFQMIGRFQLQGMGTFAYALGGVMDHFVLLLIELCMVQYYLDLFRKPASAAPAAPQVSPAP